MSSLKAEAYWRSFLKTNVVDSNMGPSIVDSWQRCALKKVDPNILVKDRLTPEQLDERLQKNSKLISIAIPFMHRLYQFVQGSGFLVMLADSEGYLLEIIGDEQLVIENDYFCKGERWTEEVKGTNAIGTVMYEKKPIQTNCNQHYCSPNHYFTCSAAPIFNPDGQLAGILDVSGDHRRTHSHTLGMVVASVGAIENEMRLERALKKVNLAYTNMQTIVETVADGIISFDGQGIITNLNRLAETILESDSNYLLGRDIRFAIDSMLIEELLQGESFHDFETFYEQGGKRIHFTSSGQPIRAKTGEVLGGVLTVREMKSVKTLVNKMVGAQARFTFDDIITNNPGFEKVIKVAQKVADSNSSVLLIGESGTGKEMFAQAIHNHSKRRGGPFIAMNCAAIPRDLVESELFGYEDGAFTGAKKGGRPGKFELATGGTIFLDEIGDMPLEFQATILRVLQEKKIVRVGGTKEIPVDIRVIAATHKDLHGQVDKGEFRLDLFYRLNVISINIPPLWRRVQDIIFLVEYFLRKYSNGSSFVLSKEVEQVMLNYKWPGNVRELENSIERATKLAADNTITLDCLPERVINCNNAESTKKVQAKLSSIKQAERNLIIESMGKNEWNMSKVAKALGIGRNTLYRKLKEYDIGNVTLK